MSNTEEPNDVKIDHRGFFLTEYSHPGKSQRVAVPVASDNGLIDL